MVSRQAKYRKKRYAEDPEYRKKRCEISRSFWVANKDEINARRRERLRTDPQYRERKHGYRTRRFGFSRDDYEALLAQQGGVCAICRKKPERPKRRLGIDHCHLTNEVRGLLCSKCNVGLGMFDDDPRRLRAAARYLERSRRAPLSMRRQSTGTPAMTSTAPTEARSVTSARKPAQPGRPSAASGRSSSGTPRTTPLGQQKLKRSNDLKAPSRRPKP